MEFSPDVLSNNERAMLRLRTLYRQYGYAPYKMSRFEEYSLYAENKAFLASGEIAAFTGPGGKLMALRPDVTLSIVKNTRDDGALKKLYYNEYVYRPGGYEYKEQMQAGLECIGDIDTGLVCEVVMLAHQSLTALGGNYYLTSANSGDTRPVRALSGGAGSVVGGSLERSNVEVAGEFVNLILAQNGFQANARTISVANDMIREVSNLLR